jgi:hypothetical protein
MSFAATTTKISLCGETDISSESPSCKPEKQRATEKKRVGRTTSTTSFCAGYRVVVWWWREADRFEQGFQGLDRLPPFLVPVAFIPVA